MMLKYILLVVVFTPNLVYGQVKVAPITKTKPVPAPAPTPKTTPSTTPAPTPAASAAPVSGGGKEWDVIGAKTRELLSDTTKPATQEEVAKHIEVRRAHCEKNPKDCGDLSSNIGPICASSGMTLPKKALIDSMIPNLANNLDFSTTVIDRLRSDCKEQSDVAFYLATELLNAAGNRNYRLPFIALAQWVPVLFKTAPPNMLVPFPGSDIAPLTAFHSAIENFYASSKPIPLSVVRNVDLTIANWSKNQPKAFYTHKAWRDWVTHSSPIFVTSGYAVALYNILKDLPKSEWEREVPWFVDQTAFACTYLVTIGQYKNCLDKIQILENRTVGNRPLTHSILLSRVFVQAKGGQTGEATKTMQKINSDLKPNDDAYPWSLFTSAYLSLAKEDPSKARASIDEFLLSKVASKTEVNMAGRSLRIAVLIEQKEETQALQDALALEKEITAAIAGTTEIKVWVQFNILRLYVQKKDAANVAKWYGTIKASIKAVPSLSYLTSLVEALKSASEGKYDLKLMDPARQIVGKNDPDIKRVEKFILSMKQ